MPGSLILGLLALGALLWWLLDRHEKRRAAAGKARHSGLRLIFAAAALLVMLFSGGCSLLFLAHMDGAYVTLPAILVIGGPPFLAGLLVWWLAIRRKSG
jgi:cyanate permease